MCTQNNTQNHNPNFAAAVVAVAVAVAPLRVGAAAASGAAAVAAAVAAVARRRRRFRRRDRCRRRRRRRCVAAVAAAVAATAVWCNELSDGNAFINVVSKFMSSVWFRSALFCISFPRWSLAQSLARCGLQLRMAVFGSRRGRWLCAKPAGRSTIRWVVSCTMPYVSIRRAILELVDFYMTGYDSIGIIKMERLVAFAKPYVLIA